MELYINSVLVFLAFSRNVISDFYIDNENQSERRGIILNFSYHEGDGWQYDIMLVNSILMLDIYNINNLAMKYKKDVNNFGRTYPDLCSWNTGIFSNGRNSTQNVVDIRSHRNIRDNLHIECC